MEIIDLKKYLTPLEIRSNNCDVNIYSDSLISSSNFYNTIFKKETGTLRKRLFKIVRSDKVISVVNSLIPQNNILSEEIEDVEANVDKNEKVTEIYYDIMLTWPSNEENKIFAVNEGKQLLQILLKKSFFLTKTGEIIRYQEDAMLPSEFSLRKS